MYYIHIFMDQINLWLTDLWCTNYEKSIDDCIEFVALAFVKII